MTPWNVDAKEGVFGEDHYSVVRARGISEQREVNRVFRWLETIHLEPASDL
jgi:hypothetical protein